MHVMQVVDLEQLKRQGLLWRGRRGRPVAGHVLASGWPVLDELLGGGWPRAALIELLSEAHHGLSLLLPLLARLSEDQRWLAWIAPPYVPYAPALHAHGVQIERLLLLRDLDATQRLWAAEQALKSGGCGAVLVWPGQVGGAQLRRLQLAAEQGDCPAVLFRPLRTLAQGSPAALRLGLRPSPLGIEVELVKRRGAWGGARCVVPISRGEVFAGGPSARPRPPTPGR